LRDFYCHENQLTGPIPSLSGLTNLKNFFCYSNQLTGPIISLSALVNLQIFNCSVNQITGSIPSLNGLNNLTNFYCNSNQLTGPIPSLNGLNNLQDFYCLDNQLTSFAGGSVSNTLGNFQAQSNQLNQSSVNAILLSFRNAGKNAGARFLQLDGAGNASPTSGINNPDKRFLETGLGWTVLVNP
jgi:Leucine-rich repeat (LRR) protein